MKINRVWAMPSKHTFQVKPLLDIVQRYRDDDEIWIDPFAGFHSPVPVRYQNDLNQDTPARSHDEAFVFVQRMIKKHGNVDGVIFDPPYSLTQVSRSYKDIGLKLNGNENPTGGFPKVRDAIRDIVKPGGFVVSFGWNTVGMGKGREFRPIEYLICSHGGNRNDTLVTVEQRL